MSNKDDNLELYLKLDEVQDQQVIDTSANRLDGNVHGNPTVVDGDILEKCLSFDGENDYIKIPESDAINFETHQDFTFEFWVKIVSPQKVQFNGVGPVYIFGKGSPYLNGPELSIQYVEKQQEIHAVYSDGINYLSLSTRKLTDNQFYHIAFVTNKKNFYLYLNGKKQGDESYEGLQNKKDNSSLYLARGGSDVVAKSTFFTGQLACFRIYSRPLSQQEIKRDMALNITPELEDELNKSSSLNEPQAEIEEVFNELQNLKKTQARIVKKLNKLQSLKETQVGEHDGTTDEENDPENKGNQSPNDSQDRLSEQDNWQVISNLFELPAVDRENSEANETELSATE
ncbi:MAG TPA: hypothetical protein DCF68_18695 [Cyanothece sp. UBA12306]|nr:hypothetical protein [Cyanothece sp. UBA12306]